MNILFYNLIHVCVTIYNLKIREFLFKNLQFLCFCAPLATWKHKLQFIWLQNRMARSCRIRACSPILNTKFEVPVCTTTAARKLCITVRWLQRLISPWSQIWSHRSMESMNILLNFLSSCWFNIYIYI